MYLHLGKNVVVSTKSIIGIFDLDNTSKSLVTRETLDRAEKEKNIINVSEELPKSFVICGGKRREKIYVSQLSTATLIKRMISRDERR